MQLRVIYDPILRQKTDSVEVFDSTLKREADEMVKIMRSHNGIGLAANQVGLNKQLVVIEFRSDDEDLPSIPLMQLCNPRVVKSSKEKESMNEACLSIPGLELPVVRSAGVTVEAQDLTGKTITIKAKGLLARVLQHEVDHLSGVLFTDRADTYKDLADYRFARIVFFGSDDFSVPVFQSLVGNGLNVIAVITETDKPAGRGNKITPPIMKSVAQEAGVAVLQPNEKSEIAALLRQLEPDLVILASYGKILPPDALEVPTFASLNVHPSLLPKYRGATPIQTAILNGDTETGVTIMQMVAEVDAGGIIAQAAEPILPTDTTLTLKHRLSELGAKALLKALPAYLSGQAKIVPQTNGGVISTKKLDKQMGEIDWQKPIEKIDRDIRALQPWPGAYTFVAGKRLKVLSSHLQGGKLVFGEVQLEGKSPSRWEDFQRGYAHLLKNEPWYAKIV